MKKLFWNKHATEAPQTKINWLQFWFGGIRILKQMLIK